MKRSEIEIKKYLDSKNPLKSIIEQIEFVGYTDKFGQKIEMNVAFIALKRLSEKPEKKVCRWKNTDIDADEIGIDYYDYESECGGELNLQGSIKENEFKICTFCGEEIEEEK